MNFEGYILCFSPFSAKFACFWNSRFINIAKKASCRIRPVPNDRLFQSSLAKLGAKGGGRLFQRGELNRLWEKEWICIFQATQEVCDQNFGWCIFDILVCCEFEISAALGKGDVKEFWTIFKYEDLQKLCYTSPLPHTLENYPLMPNLTEIIYVSFGTKRKTCRIYVPCTQKRFRPECPCPLYRKKVLCRIFGTWHNNGGFSSVRNVCTIFEKRLSVWIMKFKFFQHSDV